MPPLGAANFLAEKRQEEDFRILDTTRMVEQHTAARHGLEIVTGYHTAVYAHHLELYRQLWREDESDYVEITIHSPRELVCPVILDLMNVKYLITTDLHLGDGYEHVYQTPETEFRRRRHVYRRNQALPRAFLVARAETPPGELSVLDALCSMNPRQVCLVESQPIPGTAPFQELPIDRRSPADLTLRFATDQPGVAVLSQSWHPDWRATDNGVPIKIRRVNHGQIGIPVDAASHGLRVWYYPWDFYLGAVVSGVTWVAILAFGLVAWVKRKPTQPL
jgi:hypothetical protein